MTSTHYYTLFFCVNLCNANYVFIDRYVINMQKKLYDRLAPMCQTYANFPCAFVVNYRYEAGNGSKE